MADEHKHIEDDELVEITGGADGPIIDLDHAAPNDDDIDPADLEPHKGSGAMGSIPGPDVFDKS